MAHANRTWLDVNLSLNLAAMLRGLDKFPSVLRETLMKNLNNLPQGLREIVLGEISRGVENHESITDDRYVTHEEYMLLERAVVDTLGHPYHLRALGVGAKSVSHGSEQWSIGALNSGLKYVTTPGFGSTAMPKGAALWNKNKLWDVKHTKDTITIRANYIRDPETGVRRNGTDDAVSALHWIVGISAVFPAHWPGQELVSEVTVKAVPVNIEKYLTTWIKGCRVSHKHVDGTVTPLTLVRQEQFGEGDQILLNNEVVGKVIRHRNRINSQTVWAVEITRTITSLCTRTGDYLPLIEAGTRCQLDDINEIEQIEMVVDYRNNEKSVLMWVVNIIIATLTLVTWIVPTLLKKAFGLISRAGHGQLSAEIQLTHAKALEQQRSEHIKKLRTLISTEVSDDDWFYQVVDGTFQPRDDQFAVVCFLDLVGYSQLETQMSSHLRAQDRKLDYLAAEKQARVVLRESINRMQDFAEQVFCKKFGALSPKVLGDGAVFYMTPGHSGDQRDGRLPDVQCDLAQKMIEAAQEFMKEAAQRTDPLDQIHGGVHIRVGIHAGNLSMSLTRGHLDILGATVNMAQRHEAIAATDSICISWETATTLEMQPLETVPRLSFHLLKVAPTIGVDGVGLNALQKHIPKDTGVTLGGVRLRYNGEILVKHGEPTFSFTVAETL